MSYRIILTHNVDHGIAQLDKLPAEVIRRVDQGMARGAAELARDMRERVAKSSSQLTNRIQPQRIRPLEHHVVAAAEHASYVEEGTGPGGMPGMNATLSWMRRAGIEPRTPGMKRRSLAQLIRRSIARKGTPAQPYARPAFNAKRSRLVQLMQAGATQALQAYR